MYLASWPVFALAAVLIAITFGQEYVTTPDVPAEPAPACRRPATPRFPMLPPLNLNLPLVGMIALGVVLSVLCVIRLEYNYRGLLVLRGGIGQQRGRWKPVYSDFVRIWLATLGVFLASVIGVVLLAVGVTLGLQAVVPFAEQPTKSQFALLIVVSLLAAFVGLIVATAPARAYREARLFQLIWNNVGLSHIARFKNELRPWAYVRLRLKNLLLTVLTLGFYRAFARVSEHRMKVDSVTLHVKGGLDQLVGQLAKQQGGLGDALADAVGLDLIG